MNNKTEESRITYNKIAYEYDTSREGRKYPFSSVLSNSVNICRTEVLVEICNIMYN